MYFKRLFVLLLALLALAVTSVLPALGQDAPWFVYVYNGRDMVRVGLDGAAETFNLGLGENVFVGAREMAFTADGSRAAFCATSYPPAVEGQASEPPTTRLILRDIPGQTNLFEVDLGSAIGCRVGQTGMSADGSLLAVGLITIMPGDAAADASQPAWRLLVLDAATGGIAYELNALSPGAVSAFGETLGPRMPFVQHVDSGGVIFALMHWFTEGYIEAVHRWDFAAGTLQLEASEQWAQFFVDTLDATGEKTWVAADPDLPATTPMGPSPLYNVVRTADAGGQITTIYHNAEANPGDARFINNGQQVAILLSPTFDETNPGAPVEYRWLSVDRAGSVADLVTDVNFSYLVGAPDGYVRLIWESPDQNPSNATYRLLYTAGGQATELWSMASAGGDQYASWELAWAVPMPAAENLPPFTPIAS